MSKPQLAKRLAYPKKARPLVYGHRGLNTVAPENTIAALEAAAAAEADGVEFDVRPCRSGQLVLLHDACITRLSHGADKRLVKDLSLRQLSERSVDTTGEPVPTLPDALAACTRLGLAINVEVKRDVQARKALVKEVARVLAGVAASVPLVVSCFDPIMLFDMRRVAPEIPIALLVDRDGPSSKLAWLAGWLGAVGIHPHNDWLTAARTQRYKERGFIMMGFTINDPRRIHELAAMGVHGIVTDDPAAAHAALT